MMSLMSDKKCSGFVHSVKVPRIYKAASSIVKKVVENGESLKSLIYSTRHKNIKGIYALVVETIKHSQTLDLLMKKSKLLIKEVRLEPWLAKVLVVEMLFRKKPLKGNCKPIQCILFHQLELEECMKNLGSIHYSKKVKRPRYVRVNTLLCTPDEVIKAFRNEGWILLETPPDYSDFLRTISTLQNFEFTKDFHIKELLVFPSNARFYKNQLYINGSLILQDKASCLPVHLLNPPPHSTVLDMCAAPGVKTSHLCARMKNKGSLYAAEMNPFRYNAMQKFLQNLGCANVKPIHIDALLIGQNKGDRRNGVTPWYKNVEYILVDPSCSGTGMIERKSIFKDNEISRQRLIKLAGFQFKLLMHALTDFPNAKRVVYSTCSMEKTENEELIERVLKELNSKRADCIEDEKRLEGFKLVRAMETWLHRGSDDYEHGNRCLYADPENDLTNGFFVAVFEKYRDRKK